MSKFVYARAGQGFVCGELQRAATPREVRAKPSTSASASTDPEYPCKFSTAIRAPETRLYSEAHRRDRASPRL